MLSCYAWLIVKFTICPKAPNPWSVNVAGILDGLAWWRFIFKDNNISWYNCINKCEEIDALISIHRRKPTYAFLSHHSPHCDPVFRVCIFVDCLWVFRMWRGEQEREIYWEGAQSWALSEVLHFSFGILRIAPFDITKKLNLPNPSLSLRKYVLHFEQNACIYVENIITAGGFLMKTKCILYMFQRLRKQNNRKWEQQNWRTSCKIISMV